MSEIDSQSNQQEQLFDHRFPDIASWAAERGHLQRNYVSGAKEPTVPFAPLKREIGVEPVMSTEIPKITKDDQQQIARWVSTVKSPYDLIQRAEGQETPGQVYTGAQNKAVKNLETGLGKAIVQSKAGRAAIRRQYKTTHDHAKIAEYRLRVSTAAFVRMKSGKAFTLNDRKVVAEMIQELGNGLAANIDDLFPGGDGEARIMGNGILAVAAGIYDGTIEPATQTQLMYAARAYVAKQHSLWEEKLTQIYDFAAEKDFAVSSSDEEVA